VKTIAWEIREPDRAADKGVKVASAEDLLALKLAVIHERVEAKDYLAICALLRGGLSLAEGLAHLDARHPLATDAMIGSKTLTYFKGGDLDALPAKVKSDLEAAVRAVRDVRNFAEKKRELAR
jgi:hypothetical protein